MQLIVEKPKLTSYQKDFLYNGARFTFTEASTKAGKTFAHIWWIYERAHEPGISLDIITGGWHPYIHRQRLHLTGLG